MTIVVPGSPAFYKAATEDLAKGQPTQGAESLLQELKAELDAGQPVKSVEKALKAKGGGAYSGAVVGLANTQIWRRILETGSQELSEGQKDTADHIKALKLVDAMLSEDPRLATVGPKLESLGASKELAEFLAGHGQARKSQINASLISIVLGLAAAAIGIYVFATWNPASPEKPHPGLMLMVILGLGAAGKGVSGLWRK